MPDRIPRLLALLVAALLATACGGGAADAPTAVPADVPAATSAPGDGAQVDTSRLSSELRVYNWGDYVDPDVLDEFEQEFGVTVVLDVFPANEDMIAKVRAGGSGYDIVVPTDYAVQIMADDSLLAKLDKTLLPNISHIDPGLLDKYFDAGNVYSVPYLYGTTGIAYNQARLAELGVAPPDSWAALFDPAQAQQYAKLFSMLDDERETPGAALKYLGHSLNATDPAALDQARQVLLAQKPLLAAYNSSDVNRKLAGDEYVLAHAFSGDAMQAHAGLEGEFEGNPDIKFVIPKEGGTIWMDNLAILADSPNAYTAHVFINYMLRPEVAARNAEYVGYLTPNKDAVPLLSQETRDLYAQGFAPDAATLERLEWIERNEQNAAFTDLWTAVKGE